MSRPSVGTKVGEVAGIDAVGRGMHPVDGRPRLLRWASVAVLIGFLWLWHARTTGTVSWPAWLLLAGFVGTCVAFGSSVARATAGLVDGPIGIAYELLAGFLVGNTVLFVLTLVSPLGMGAHLALLAVAAAVIAAVLTRPTRRPVARSVQAEAGSLACIVFAGLAATLWVGEQQPITTVVDGRTVFTVWSDIFIHAREISAFAQAHGFRTLVDIKLAGVPAPAYHFASYMMPAALNAVTGTSALDAYAAFQLPFGILLTALGAYVMAAAVLRTTWPAVAASAALIALPDTYHQLVGVRYLSFHFMTQVNLGMLYGLACIALAWVFMIEGCRKARAAGVVIAWLLLATCLTYKAHLFVANALILMLYPCAFFGRIRWPWRVLAAAVVVALFIAVVTLSQTIPRVPVLRLDGSGLARYVEILDWTFRPGAVKDAFDWLYFKHRWPSAVNALIAATFIGLGTFGFWGIAAPFVVWRARRATGWPVIGFVVLVVVNYMVMSMFLALLDDPAIGSPEEFVNRPSAWACFVVVVLVAALLARSLRSSMAKPAMRWLGAGVAVLALVGIPMRVHDFQTIPEFGQTAYVQFNSESTCLVEAARYVRDHGRRSDQLLDSQFDPRLITTAVSERQGYVSAGTFGGHMADVKSRIDAIDAVRSGSDPADGLRAWSRAHQVAWYLMHPEDATGWDARSLDQAAFRCGGYRVFRFA